MELMIGEINEFIIRMQKHFSVDLLKGHYKYLKNVHPSTGHCYIASEVVFHEFRDRYHLQPMVGRDQEGNTHWWLKDISSGAIIDPTYQQFYSIGKIPPYDRGKPCPFMTPKLSKRGRILRARIDTK